MHGMVYIVKSLESLDTTGHYFTKSAPERILELSNDREPQKQHWTKAFSTFGSLVWKTNMKIMVHGVD